MSEILHCVVLDDYQSVARDFIERAPEWEAIKQGVHIDYYNEHFNSDKALLGAIKPCQIVIAMRERTHFHAELFSNLPNLKLLVTSGMRNAAIDLDAAKKSGIIVSGTQSAKGPPTELTWGLILSLARNISLENPLSQTALSTKCLTDHIFVVAKDMQSAKQEARKNTLFKQKRMHIDSIQEIRTVDGYVINPKQCNAKGTEIVNYVGRGLV